VEDGVSGFLVPPGDSQAVVHHVDQLLADADLRNQFGTSGRRKVEQEFNISLEADRLRHVLTSALAGQGTPVRPDIEAAPLVDGCPPISPVAASPVGCP